MAFSFFSFVSIFYVMKYLHGTIYVHTHPSSSINSHLMPLDQEIEQCQLPKDPIITFLITYLFPTKGRCYPKLY